MVERDPEFTGTDFDAKEAARRAAEERKADLAQTAAVYASPPSAVPANETADQRRDREAEEKRRRDAGLPVVPADETADQKREREAAEEARRPMTHGEAVGAAAQLRPDQGRERLMAYLEGRNPGDVRDDRTRYAGTDGNRGGYVGNVGNWPDPVPEGKN